jgi:signal transduction histidine kinase
LVTELCGDRFVPELEEAAWFIACEAVANAVKHAEASSVRLSAVRNNGRLLLSIADDGAGGANPGGRGLRGISDRAEAIGGKLSVESKPGHGTVVKAELPCG